MGINSELGVSLNPGARSPAPHSLMTREELQQEWKRIQAAQRQPEAFGPLYEHYFESVYTFVYQRTRDEHLAADLTQDTFFKALQNLSRYRQRQVPFKAWLLVIARNEINQYYRDKKRPVLVESEALLELMDSTDTKWTQPDRDYIPVLLQALGQLEPDKLELLEWFHFEKRSFQEIADLLNARQMLRPESPSLTEVSANTVKVRTKRARDKVAQLMNDLLSSTS